MDSFAVFLIGCGLATCIYAASMGRVIKFHAENRVEVTKGTPLPFVRLGLKWHARMQEDPTWGPTLRRRFWIIAAALVVVGVVLFLLTAPFDSFFDCTADREDAIEAGQEPPDCD